MLLCPQKHAPVSTHISKQRLQATFDRSICTGCALRSQCPAVSTRKHERWQYTHERVQQRARRLEEEKPAFKERYRWRAGVEGTMSRLKHQMGMGKLRVRGKSAITYATFMRALGLNIFRVAAWKQRMALLIVYSCHILPFIVRIAVGSLIRTRYGATNNLKIQQKGKALPAW
jgi:hypothetical protein